MQQQNVLEVVTPALSVGASTDPNIHSFRINNHYLHTSPEFPMKRLLAAHERDIYQIATVFRDGEVGRHHNAEFSLLEWYRVGMDHLQLIDDIVNLLALIAKQFNVSSSVPVTVRYTEAVSSMCEVPFSDVSVEKIERVFADNKRSYPTAIGDDVDAALDLLIDEFVVANFPTTQISIVLDYPASQASLARISHNNDSVGIAERFEVYWGQKELANGFHELANAQEQRARFEADLALRAKRGQTAVPIDQRLLQALEHGLPDCAGVALGLDRLLMVLTGEDHIDNVLAFSTERA